MVEALYLSGCNTFVGQKTSTMTGDDRAELYELTDRLVECYAETIEHYLAADTDGYAGLAVRNIGLI